MLHHYTLSWIGFFLLLLPEEAGYCLRRCDIFGESNFCLLYWAQFRLRLVGHLQVRDEGVVQRLGEGGVVVGVGGKGHSALEGGHFR